MDLHDARMFKLCCGGCFPFEPDHGFGPEGEVGGQDLEGHGSAQRSLPGFIDHAHAAASHFFYEMEITQCLVWNLFAHLFFFGGFALE